MYSKLQNYFKIQDTDSDKEQASKLVHLEITNDSHKHAHHSAMLQDPDNAARGETHFTVLLVSEEFNGMTLINRHRLVNKILEEELSEKGVHALSIKAYTTA